MTLETVQTVPLTQWEDGSIRITESRVTLESIVHQFKLGASAEHIQDAFPSLSLREIHGALFYYLENTEVVEEYLRQREEAAEEGKRFIDEHFDNKELIARLRARREQLSQHSKK